MTGIEVVGIAAVARNQVIGSGSDIPWRIPEDWRRFKALTTGHALVMGRKTYDSIGRPLPGRVTVVVTRDPGWQREGVLVAGSVAEALTLAEQALAGRSADPTSSAGAAARGTVYVAGGGEIYRAAWSRLDRLEVTEVDRAPEGDVTFPDIDPEEWRETSRDVRDGFSFVTYGRRRNPA